MYIIYEVKMYKMNGLNLWLGHLEKKKTCSNLITYESGHKETLIKCLFSSNLFLVCYK